MRISQFQKEFESLAPPAVAWKGDNVGLLIGRPDDRITNAIVALDLTRDVAAEAVSKKANLIITHHPLLFHPMKSITPSSRAGELVLMLTGNRINLYAAHTNLDSVKWGVNFSLAKQLGLSDVRILSPISDSLLKIVVFVPHGHAGSVSRAMHDAGAGMFTQYDTCSFRSEGTGTFRGLKDAKPFLGTIGNVENVKEIRLEMLVEQWKLRGVVSAMLKAHPYEEAAYDLYPLQNKNSEFGLGAIGLLAKPMTQRSFLAFVKKRLGADALRFSGKAATVHRVAVCGGSGSEFIQEAAAQGADAMVTADLKYHTFQEYEERILLVDAGHFETESGVLPALKESIAGIFRKYRHSGKVFITRYSTNPVHIF